MPFIRAALVILMLASVHSAAGALAANRVALVVGIDAYDNLPPEKQLKKAVNDARAVSAALAGLGFEVIKGENVTRRDFYRLWSGFLAKLNPGDTAGFYFSGHGVDLDGNYLVPRDVQAITDESSLRADAVNFRDLLGDLRAKRVAVSFEILDACRDNPFASERGRSIGGERGLGRPDNAEGNFILYSAGERQTALDALSDADPDPNSIFTRSLLPLLKKDAGLSLDGIAKKVRGAVRGLALQANNHRQFPAYYNELTDDVYLGATPAETPAGADVAKLRDQVARLEEALKARPSGSGEGALREELAELRAEMKARRDARAKPEAEKAKETQTAMAGVSAVRPVPPPADTGCDGLVVSVTFGENPCIKPGSGGVFKDCADCPEMTVLPSGSFLMGSPPGEEGRFDEEGPVHKVTIAQFAVGRTHVTRGQFATFVKATGHKTDGGCYTWSGSELKDDKSASWRAPGFEQGDDHPVVCVNWNDATAYAAWLKKTTSQSYRLLSEAEAEYAARGATVATAQPRYFFGNDEKDLCGYANGADETAKAKFANWKVAPCKDGYVFTAPVMSFKPNAFGLYDVHGNAWTWTQNCWNGNYNNAPADGSVRTTGDCGLRVLRGGCWSSNPGYLRAARRLRNDASNRIFDVGFRVARTF